MNTAQNCTGIFFLLPHDFANLALICCTPSPHTSCSLKFSLITCLLSFFLIGFIFFFPQSDPAVVYLLPVLQLCSHTVVAQPCRSDWRYTNAIKGPLVTWGFTVFRAIFNSSSNPAPLQFQIIKGLSEIYPVNEINPNKGIWISQFSMLLCFIAFSISVSGFSQTRGLARTHLD